MNHLHHSTRIVAAWLVSLSVYGSLFAEDKPVWEVAWRKPPFDPKELFFIRVHSRDLSLKKLFQFSK